MCVLPRLTTIEHTIVYGLYMCLSVKIFRFFIASIFVQLCLKKARNFSSSSFHYGKKYCQSTHTHMGDWVTDSLENIFDMK